MHLNPYATLVRCLLLIALQTQVGHRATSEKCQLQTSTGEH